MSPHEHGSRPVAASTEAASASASRTATPSGGPEGVGFGLLTLLTHAANLAFVALAGRLLAPGDFADLVAVLGIVLVGLAPGMALQALAATGVLGRPVLVDRLLGRRSGLLVGVVVAVLTLTAWWLLELDGVLVMLAVPVAAALLPRTAVNEGLLQGHRRFLLLGTVMLVGATTKLALGTAAMATAGTVGTAALAVTAGHVAQLASSRAATRGTSQLRAAPAVDRQVVRAVALTGGLLLLVHLDAVLAPAVLADVPAGRYGVGVTAARITFWLPQFAVLLWFPRMVRDAGRTRAREALGGVVTLAVLGVVGAVLGGPVLATAVFGAELGAVGPHLWRFVLVGAANLGVQVLVLTDIATGRHRVLPVLLAALVAVPAALLLVGPATAASAAGVVAGVLGVTVAVGAVRVLGAAPRATPA